MFVRKGEFFSTVDLMLQEIDYITCATENHDAVLREVVKFSHEDDVAITALWHAIANLEAVVYAPTAKPKAVKVPVSTPDIAPKKRISATKTVAGSNRTKKA